MAKILLRRFIPVPLYFTESKKVKWLMKRNPINAGHVIISLLAIWGQCRDRYQDGKLHMDAEDIEVTFNWLGKAGEFIKIATNEKTRFLNKISENEYQVHDWYKNNPDLNPKVIEDISKQNSGNAHKGYHKKDVDRLSDSGIDDYTKCRWFKPALDENGRIAVNLKNLPSKMFLDGQQFHTAPEFKQFFNMTCDKEGRGRVLGLIKANTKICTSCKKMHINDQLDKCYDCQGR